MFFFVQQRTVFWNSPSAMPKQSGKQQFTILNVQLVACFPEQHLPCCDHHARFTKHAFFNKTVSEAKRTSLPHQIPYSPRVLWGEAVVSLLFALEAFKSQAETLVLG